MSDAVFYVLSAILSLMVLLGIHWMSKVETAPWGNRLSALAMLCAILVTFIKYGLLGIPDIWIGLGLGSLISLVIAKRIKMIAMPQLVGLLNGLGGFASAGAALLTLGYSQNIGAFERATALLGMAVGAFTFSGSMVAAGKLHRLLPQKPVMFPSHRLLLSGSIALMALLVVLAMLVPSTGVVMAWLLVAVSLLFGLLFALPVGGADMPITISLLNSSSGVAAAITGMAIGDVLLVAVGGIVGASGLLLTQIMCRAMNRKLSAILLSKSVPTSAAENSAPSFEKEEESGDQPLAMDMPAPKTPAAATQSELPIWLADAKSVIIIPGYGMAVSQAQEQVKALHDALEKGGRSVRFAIHPVAGRMPGHMNVLLAEVDIPYDKLFEMDEINPDMEKTDLVLVIGANDVVNPAANTAEGTPIYGLPVLDAQNAKRLVICNFDSKPGYAGVDNPLYGPHPDILLMFGDAKESLTTILSML